MRIADLKEETTLGRIDILVANAGGPLSGFRGGQPPAAPSNSINLSREAVPHMRERGWGRIVAITSTAAKQPINNLILSNTARAGVLGFIKSLSDQVAQYGITANVVCPSYHMTERLKGLAASIAQHEGISVKEVYGRWAASVPIGRIGDPKEFAALVAFPCSERASYITGTVIQIDGGAYRALY